LLLASASWAANPVVPGSSRVDATPHALGVRWTISGDDNRNSTFGLEFRRLGEPTWRPAAPPMRSDPDLVVDGAPLGLHHWAASAMFLDPGTTYELRLTLGDPDGGGEVRVVAATTGTLVPDPPLGTIRWVVPGNGGGSGTQGNPYLGLQAAADAAAPGDLFLVAPGTYADFAIATSGTPGAPISFVGPGAASPTPAIVDGAATDRGVVTIGTDSSAPISHVIIQGLVIQNGLWGVDAQHSSDITVRGTWIRDVGYGVINRRAADLERRQMVCDNLIEGREPWPGAGIPPTRGIDLRGWGHTVCRNQVSNFGDCISLQPHSGPSFGSDVFANDTRRCVDDGIEIDFNQSNVRVWRNRVFNARMGISVQPVAGGPAYLVRNELFNLEDKALKLHNAPAGLVVAHNTGVKLGNAVHDPSGSVWQNAWFRNNLFLGTAYAFELVTSAGSRDFDFNAWGTTRAGTSAEPHFKWNTVRYDNLAALQIGAGIEGNGVVATFADLANATLPPTWDTSVDPETRDLRLVGSADAVDAGAALPNLNDTFPTTGAPDLGAFELGQPKPRYGPRLGLFWDGFESGGTGAWSEP
jgi:hypothetical protein